MPYRLLVSLILALHIVWLVWVIFGWLVTRNRPLLSWVHIGCLIYGILIEVIDFPCPLTMVEDAARRAAGMTAYQEGCIAHYLAALVYPNVSPVVLTWFGVTVCALNLGIYGWRWTKGFRNQT